MLYQISVLPISINMLLLIVPMNQYQLLVPRVVNYPFTTIVIVHQIQQHQMNILFYYLLLVVVSLIMNVLM